MFVHGGERATFFGGVRSCPLLFGWFERPSRVTRNGVGTSFSLFVTCVPGTCFLLLTWVCCLFKVGAGGLGFWGAPGVSMWEGRGGLLG